MPALSGKNGNGDKAAHEGNVQEYAEEGKESNASQKACQDDGECCVENGTARHALNRLFPSRDGRMMSPEPCQASVTSNEHLDDVLTCEIPRENREH